MSSEVSLFEQLFAEILSATHAYTPGLEPGLPTLTGAPASWRQAARLTKEGARDTIERLAKAAGFTHRHFDPLVSGRELARLVELRGGLEETYARLADDPSRRALIDVLKLRVLGAPHTRLRLTPQAFRQKQEWLDREHRLAFGTFEVSDPWFSPLSHYRIGQNGAEIELHAHSVDIVSVFMLGQYSYGAPANGVRAVAGDIVLDVGGCWGDTALHFAQQVGPAGKVFTFEFDPENLAILRANLALNPRLASRVEVIERALWNRSGETLSFNRAGRCTSVFEAASAHDEPSVETVTIDDFLREASLKQVDFLKMDVEGAELSVLEGAEECLSRLRPKMAIAAYHNDDDLITIPQTIARSSAGYRFFLASYSPVEDETVLFAAATD